MLEGLHLGTIKPIGEHEPTDRLRRGNGCRDRLVRHAADLQHARGVVVLAQCAEQRRAVVGRQILRARAEDPIVGRHQKGERDAATFPKVFKRRLDRCAVACRNR